MQTKSNRKPHLNQKEFFTKNAMINKKNNLFRQQAIENITPPEKIGLFIKIASPSVLTIVLATSLFTISLIIWSISYKIDTIIPIGAICENGYTNCFLNESDFEKLKNTKNPNIIINETTYTIKKIDNTAQKIDRENFSYAMHKSRIKPGDWAFKIDLATKNLEDGTFSAWLVTNKIAPISYIFN